MSLHNHHRIFIQTFGPLHFSHIFRCTFEWSVHDIYADVSRTRLIQSFPMARVCYHGNRYVFIKIKKFCCTLCEVIARSRLVVILRDIMVLIWWWIVRVYVILLCNCFVTVKIIVSIRRQQVREVFLTPPTPLFAPLRVPPWFPPLSFSFLSCWSSCIYLNCTGATSSCTCMKCSVSTHWWVLFYFEVEKKITQYNIWHCMFPITKWN